MLLLSGQNLSGPKSVRVGPLGPGMGRAIGNVARSHVCGTTIFIAATRRSPSEEVLSKPATACRDKMPAALAHALINDGKVLNRRGWPSTWSMSRGFKKYLRKVSQPRDDRRNITLGRVGYNAAKNISWASLRLAAWADAPGYAYNKSSAATGLGKSLRALALAKAVLVG